MTNPRGDGDGRPQPGKPGDMPSGRDGETASDLALRAGLGEGARRLGVELDAEAIAGLITHLDELRQWGPRLNLVSAQDLNDPRLLLDRHALDSLAAVPVVAPLADRPEIVDLGSGAGFPGIPVAIAVRSPRAVLVEPRHRRANFLRASARRLAPGVGIEVANCRFEDLPGAGLGRGFHAVLSRAALPLADLVAFARLWLRPGGRLVAFRGPTQVDEPVDLPGSGLRRMPDLSYRVASAGPQMRLAVWEKTG